MSDEDDERIRSGIKHTFAPDWASNVGKRIGNAVKDNGVAQAVARKLVDYGRWVQSGAGKDALPKVIAEPMAKAENAYYDKAYEGQRARQAQELELQSIKDKIRAVKESQMSPQDIGDIDAPVVRQPVQMSREFPPTAQGKADEEAYIQQVRETARKASAK